MNIPESLMNRLEEARQRSVRPKFTPSDEDTAEMMIKMLEAGYRDDVDPVAFRKLARYMVTCKHKETGRGLLLSGNNGTGKTTWLKMFSGSRILCASDISELFKVHGQRDALEIVLPPKELDIYPRGYFNLDIDDLGSEKPMNEYGVKYEPLSAVIERMYNRHMVNFGHYNITTNLSQDQISERYGQRILSRLSEMFYFVPFNGKDKRMVEI